ncbi:MAG: FliI/YscN family ATPase [Candidatus Hydrogenedentes bacterium]|nr:FliI/YscN family ATPase [Candidatus Hydrogenedentota bacterium]
MIDLSAYAQRVEEARPLVASGKITDIVGLTIEASGPPMQVGDLCYVESPRAETPVPVAVVGFRKEKILLMPLGSMQGIGPGCPVRPTHRPPQVAVGPGLIGRVIGSDGTPIDTDAPLNYVEKVSLHAEPPPPLSRQRILTPIATGIRAIDGCLTCGRGQRMGIMSGSGVGKSKLIGMIARNTDADLNVIALVGERGREVREFIEGDLGAEGLARSIVVVATSDEPALLRLNGAFIATAIAEWFRAQGLNVMLIMDSITRVAMAQREVGLAVGEPPTTRGYPPSVYAMLPRLLERTGTSAEGSITGFYAVLVEADDLNDPVGDTVRSILDGHIVLSRDLAGKGHYPPVDILGSISRVMNEVTDDNHRQWAYRFRELLAAYRDSEDLINIGAYVPGSNAEIDLAVQLMPEFNAFLKQDLKEAAPFAETVHRLSQLTGNR